MSAAMIGYAYRYQGPALKKLLAIHVMDNMPGPEELYAISLSELIDKFKDSSSVFCCIEPDEASEIIRELFDEGFFALSACAEIQVESLRTALLPQRQKRKIPKAKRMVILERDDFKCRHCGSKEDLTVDHIYPEVHGGTDDYDNLQTLCRRCNSVKGDSLPEGGE